MTLRSIQGWLWQPAQIQAINSEGCCRRSWFLMLRGAGCCMATFLLVRTLLTFRAIFVALTFIVLACRAENLRALASCSILNSSERLPRWSWRKALTRGFNQVKVCARMTTLCLVTNFHSNKSYITAVQGSFA